MFLIFIMYLCNLGYVEYKNDLCMLIHSLSLSASELYLKSSRYPLYLLIKKLVHAYTFIIIIIAYYFINLCCPIAGKRSPSIPSIVVGKKY